MYAYTKKSMFKWWLFLAYVSLDILQTVLGHFRCLTGTCRAEITWYSNIQESSNSSRLVYDDTVFWFCNIRKNRSESYGFICHLLWYKLCVTNIMEQDEWWHDIVKKMLISFEFTTSLIRSSETTVKCRSSRSRLLFDLIVAYLCENGCLGFLLALCRTFSAMCRNSIVLCFFYLLQSIYLHFLENCKRMWFFRPRASTNYGTLIFL